MITHNNEALYRNLFNKARDRLKNDFNMEDVEINDLESYFAHLHDLVHGPNGEAEGAVLEAGYIFLKLPDAAEEPHFQIDANKREIITKNFNGVLSVQGDEIAEIVFFEIDRFFDATDLNEMDIAIQWSHKRNGEIYSSYTPAFIKYIENNKLIFGWPITSEITSQSGPLTFAVRFYKKDPYDDTKLVYSFTTLEAVMNIGSSLQVDVANITVDDPKKTILGRLVNSSLDGQGPSIPQFVFGNYDEYATIDSVDSNLRLYALASKATGSLSYKWFHNNKSIGDEKVWTPAVDYNYYIEVNDFVEGINTYYYDNSGNYEAIGEFISDSIAFNEKKEQYSKLYVNCACYELTPENVAVGTYHIDCRNIRNNTVVYASGKTLGDNNSILPKWEVLGPASIVFDVENWPEYFYITEDNKILSVSNLISGTEPTATYQWVRKLNENGDEINTDFTNINCEPDVEGWYKLKISNTKNNASVNGESPFCLVLKPIDETNLQLVINRNDDGSYTAGFNRELTIGESASYTWITMIDNVVVEENSTNYMPDSGLIGTGIKVIGKITKGPELSLEIENTELIK